MSGDGTWNLNQFEARAPEDSAKTVLEYVCVLCNEVLCDIEPGDTMFALAEVANKHVCKPAASTEPSKPVLKVPPLQMDVTGEYQGNAYPENREYRLHMIEGGDDTYLLSVEDNSGNEVIDTLILTDAEADGIMKVASTDHSLSVYESDWHFPAGMERTVEWDLGGGDTYLVLSSGHIDEIASWLSYATGEETWDGGDEWEF